MTRVFDVCQSCRRCVALCTSFPTLFEFVDRHADRDAGQLTPAQQDQVVDECVLCTRCVLHCPYTPDVHELAIDFPRLMLRSRAMRHETKQVAVRARVRTTVIARTDLVGRLATWRAGVTNRVLGAKSGGAIRRMVEATTGVSSVRLLPPFAKQRFSTWFEKRPKVRINRRRGRVAVVPTCFVEYQEPAIGQALVKVYERNGVECFLPEGVGCCGAPYLHGGEIERFAEVARRNVKLLAECIREGSEVVVPQATCAYVVRKEYPVHVAGAPADLVAAHTHDAVEYLMTLHQAGATLDTDFTGTVPTTVTYHAPCHLRAQGVGLKSRDLIKLTGARVTLVQECAGTGAMWGLRAENAPVAVAMAERLGGEVDRAGGEVVAGDCHLANTAIAEQTGRTPLHPLQLLAQAYGIPPE